MDNPDVLLSPNAEKVFDLARQLPLKDQKELAATLLQEILADDIPESQKVFVRESLEKYKTHPEFFVDAIEAWKQIEELE